MTTHTRITDNTDTDFIHLVQLLDHDLYERYGEAQKEFDQHNKVDHIKDVVILYQNEMPVACGAFKEYGDHTVEIKRVFVVKEKRRQGLSKIVIQELENIARSKGYRSAVLQTGYKQHEAIHLYQNAGYEITENYGPYLGDIYSICMKKIL